MPSNGFSGRCVLPENDRVRRVVPLGPREISVAGVNRARVYKILDED